MVNWQEKQDGVGGWDEEMEEGDSGGKVQEREAGIEQGGGHGGSLSSPHTTFNKAVRPG